MKLLVIENGLDRIEYAMFELLADKGEVILACPPKSRYKTQFRNVEMIPPITSKLLSWRAMLAIRKIVKEKNITAIYSSSSKGLACALMATWGLKNVKIIGYRGTGAKIRKLDISYFFAILNPRVDRIICADEHVCGILKKAGVPERKLIVNRKPYDISWVEPALEKPQIADGIPDSAFKIVYAANTKGRPYKGLRTLLEAIKLLNNPQVHFTLLGDYEEGDFAFAKEGVNAENIHFLGPRGDALHFMAGADLFVLPSYRDLSPRCVREAMACGLPCVISDIPGARNLVLRDKTALCVSPKDAKALAEAIRFFVDHENARKRFGVAGRNHIIENFSMERYLQTMQNLLKDLAGEQ